MNQAERSNFHLLIKSLIRQVCETSHFNLKHPCGAKAQTTISKVIKPTSFQEPGFCRRPCRCRIIDATAIVMPVSMKTFPKAHKPIIRSKGRNDSITFCV